MAAEHAPRLSVIIPTHDTRELTLACLTAVRTSRGVDGLEVVVVDDGSRDGTAEVIGERFPEVKLVRLDPAGGFTRAANAGVAASTGVDFVLLNSDTEVAPEALARLVAALDQDPTLGGAGAQLFHTGGALQWSAGREPTLLWLFVLASGVARLAQRLPGYRRIRALGGVPEATGGHQDVGWVPGAALALRRRAWREIGPLDGRFALYAQDLDYCVRLRRAGWRVVLVRHAHVVHHLGATIGARPHATAERVHTELLWADLVRWAAKAHGAGFARNARRALVAGARLAGVLDRLGIVPLAERDRRARGKAISALVDLELVPPSPATDSAARPRRR